MLAATVAGPDFATNPVRLQGGRPRRKIAGVTELNQIDLQALATGNKRAWDAFVERRRTVDQCRRPPHARFIPAERRRRDGCRPGRVRPAVRQRLPTAQDLRSGPRRPFDLAGGGRHDRRPWITPGAVARPPSRSTRCPRPVLGVEDRHVEKLKIPQGLLTDRQILILKCLYDEERDVAEVAQLLKIDAQTVRSTHHKALLRLRAHFGEEALVNRGYLNAF